MDAKKPHRSGMTRYLTTHLGIKLVVTFQLDQLQSINLPLVFHEFVDNDIVLGLSAEIQNIAWAGLGEAIHVNCQVLGQHQRPNAQVKMYLSFDTWQAILKRMFFLVQYCETLPLVDNANIWHNNLEYVTRIPYGDKFDYK